MVRLDYINGQMVDDAALPAGSAGVLYGLSVFTRIRACAGQDGSVRVFALDAHLDRTASAAKARFDLSDQMRQHVFLWKEWILRAVRDYLAQGGDAASCYLHLGFGPFGGAKGMLKAEVGGLCTHIFVESQSPLYGRGLYATRDMEWPRPWDVSSPYKLAANYGALFELKRRGRERIEGKRVSVPLDCAIETVLTDAFTGNVAEFGCANAGAIIGNTVHLAPLSRRFVGITEQVVLLLAERHLRLRVAYDLTISTLAQGGFAMGTAGGVVPLLWFEGEAVPRNQIVSELGVLYQLIREGSLPGSIVWTTVVPL